MKIDIESFKKLKIAEDEVLFIEVDGNEVSNEAIEYLQRSLKEYGFKRVIVTGFPMSIKIIKQVTAKLPMPEPSKITDLPINDLSNEVKKAI